MAVEWLIYMGSITIQDVARYARVSSATVSHVFNKTRYVSPEKVARVMEAAKELNYIPNTYAKSFRTGIVFLQQSLKRWNPHFPSTIIG